MDGLQSLALQVCLLWNGLPVSSRDKFRERTVWFNQSRLIPFFTSDTDCPEGSVSVQLPGATLLVWERGSAWSPSNKQALKLSPFGN